MTRGTAEQAEGVVQGEASGRLDEKLDRRSFRSSVRETPMEYPALPRRSSSATIFSQLHTTTMSEPLFIPTITKFALDSAELKDHEYILPRKLILSKENLEAFQASKTHETIVSYITTLNERVVGVKLTDEVPLSPVRKSSHLLFYAFLGLNVSAVACNGSGCTSRTRRS